LSIRRFSFPFRRPHSDSSAGFLLPLESLHPYSGSKAAFSSGGRSLKLPLLRRLSVDALFPYFFEGACASIVLVRPFPLTGPANPLPRSGGSPFSKFPLLRLLPFPASPPVLPFRGEGNFPLRRQNTELFLSGRVVPRVLHIPDVSPDSAPLLSHCRLVFSFLLSPPIPFPPVILSAPVHGFQDSIKVFFPSARRWRDFSPIFRCESPLPRTSPPCRLRLTCCRTTTAVIKESPSGFYPFCPKPQ